MTTKRKYLSSKSWLYNRPPQTTPLRAFVVENYRSAKSVLRRKWQILFRPHNQGRPARGQIRKQSRERRKQAGGWPQVLSTWQVTTQLLPRTTKKTCNIIEPGAPFRTARPRQCVSAPSPPPPSALVKYSGLIPPISSSRRFGFYIGVRKSVFFLQKRKRFLDIKGTLQLLIEHGLTQEPRTDVLTVPTIKITAFCLNHRKVW
jgi:hypothetical protein